MATSSVSSAPTLTKITNGFELIDSHYYGANGPPHDIWTQLRKESPVQWCKTPELEGFWAITLQEDSYIPTDASVFFTKGVPIISAFTGSHSEYHTPRDTPDTLNYEGAGTTLCGIARSGCLRRSRQNAAIPS